MSKFKKYGKIILFDSLAVLSFIGVILFGWLPGPGGIPLFLLGLGFLAVNHDWAERWLETAKLHGVTLKKWLFPDKPWLRKIYDVLAAILMVVGLTLLMTSTNRFATAAGVAVAIGGLFFFMLNHEHLDKIADLFKRKT